MKISCRSDREAFWRELIERRESLRLTVRRVCEEAGVSPASFFQWQRKLGGAKHRRGGKVTRATPLVPVRIVDDRVPELTLEFPNGIRLLHPQGCEEAALQRVVRSVMAASRETEPC